MICKRCGRESENGARICPYCGSELAAGSETGGIEGMRQGSSRRPPVVYGVSSDRPQRSSRYSQDAGRPEDHRAVRSADSSRTGNAERRDEKKIKRGYRSHINFALLFTVLGMLAVAAAVVLLVLAIKLPQGHLLLLRATADDPEKQERVISLIGEKEAAEALWKIGDEQIDQGYIARCIDTYEQAYALDPDIDGLYDRLLSLADAYESVGRLDEAQAIYQKLYREIDPANAYAYRYDIEILMDQGRLFEATDLMKLAYEKTGELSFKSQWEQRVPQSPASDPDSGRYMKECYVTLTSPQGYDVYYLLDDDESELPEKGILFTEPIHLGEGTHNIRAVSVSSELISSEVSLRYTIWFPIPSAPKSRLLTGEYDHPRRVYLYMEDIKVTGDTPNQIYTIYFTLDGTAPNIDSPVYTDEGFMLAPGFTKLRAVAVNQYGKVSNEYEGTYKVKGTFKLYFRDTQDQFRGFTVGETTYDAFKKLYGAGREQTVSADTVSGRALQVTYDWGTAVFTDVGQVLLSVDTGNASMTGPQGSKVGMKLEEVTALFRDMNQPANAKGNRSLYYDSATGYGRYWQDSGNSGHLEYVYLREDDAVCTLTYYLEGGTVRHISMALTDTSLE
ncbi:MAG: chitobiase/beta-hexosaminidase C-terminal domain-containing protein [Clostridia bacterium]|nr:chitobiase/beta-hexosaminidase C-terminal domain-containing protein [Clostridia bacterium]